MVSAAEQLAANHNFGAVAKAEELKKRIWFTLGALLVYRLGTYIPLPGIDPNIWEQVFKSQAGGILGMFNMFAGGGIHRMAIFALNIMPYISASIIIQLLTTVSPQLEALKKEGESGRKLLNQYTRYLTVILAAFQSYGIPVGLGGPGHVVRRPALLFPLSTAVPLIQYPKRQVGNKMVEGQSSHLPLKLNTSGVIPPIFASSLLLLPTTVANFNAGRGPEWFQWVTTQLGHGRPLFLILYLALIVF